MHRICSHIQPLSALCCFHKRVKLFCFTYICFITLESIVNQEHFGRFFHTFKQFLVLFQQYKCSIFNQRCRKQNFNIFPFPLLVLLCVKVALFSVILLPELILLLFLNCLRFHFTMNFRSTLQKTPYFIAVSGLFQSFVDNFISASKNASQSRTEPVRRIVHFCVEISLIFSLFFASDGCLILCTLRRPLMLRFQPFCSCLRTFRTI